MLNRAPKSVSRNYHIILFSLATEMRCPGQSLGLKMVMYEF